MTRFENDYHEGALPEVMAILNATNLDQTIGYGEDEWCARAADILRELSGCPQADVHFLVGGTQANFTVIGHLLRPYEAVIAADTGHINVHETGAVEATGHKVLAAPHVDGKITVRQVRQLYEDNAFDEHMARPGMVYISWPTEYGTLYTKGELEELYACCRELGMKLFVDGARIAYGLAAADCDLTLKDIAANCDVFYFGGTKAGALFGEAVVFTDPSLGKDFRYSIKQRGGMLAKGRLLGIQFVGMLEDGASLRAAAEADRKADLIREALAEKGIPLYCPNRTNQIFCTLSARQYAILCKEFVFSLMGRDDGPEVPVRICTSWATPPENTDRLIGAILAL